MFLSPAHAQMTTMQLLTTFCNTGQKSGEQFCGLYLAGLFDGFRAGNQLGKDAGGKLEYRSQTFACAPDDNACGIDQHLSDFWHYPGTGKRVRIYNVGFYSWNECIPAKNGSIFG